VLAATTIIVVPITAAADVDVCSKAWSNIFRAVVRIVVVWVCVYRAAVDWAAEPDTKIETYASATSAKFMPATEVIAAHSSTGKARPAPETAAMATTLCRSKP
jgi:hypothetical protein